MGKAQIIRRIHRAAKKYKDYFIGNTYMFVYEEQYIEVMFKKSSFLHLTGVGTNISAENFFEHAFIRNGLRPQEVLFGNDNPYDLADKKTQYLADLYIRHRDARRRIDSCVLFTVLILHCIVCHLYHGLFLPVGRWHLPYHELSS